MGKERCRCWRGTGDVTQHGIAGTAHDLAVGFGLEGLFACLIEQCLEVRHAEAVVAAHAGDRRGDALAGEFVPALVDLFGAAAHEALATADVAVDIRIEQLHEQLIQFGVDEARLREQLLRCRLVVRLGGRREVRIDLDAPAVAMAAARMDRQALEPQEDLDLVLGDLDAQLLVPVDVRGAVIVALDVDVAVGVQLGVLPFPAVHAPDRQRLECGFLQRLEALAARDAEARVASIIDALDTLAERPVDLAQGSEALAPVAEAHVAHQDFDQSFDDRLYLWGFFGRAGTTAVE